MNVFHIDTFKILALPNERSWKVIFAVILFLREQEIGSIIGSWLYGGSVIVVQRVRRCCREFANGRVSAYEGSNVRSSFNGIYIFVHNAEVARTA